MSKSRARARLRKLIGLLLDKLEQSKNASHADFPCLAFSKLSYLAVVKESGGIQLLGNLRFKNFIVQHGKIIRRLFFHLKGDWRPQS